MKNIALTLFILILLVLGIMQSGCGTRRVETQINKQSDKIDEGSKDKGQEESKSESKSEVKEENKADKTEEVVTTTIEDQLNNKGEVIKRTTTTKTEKRQDRSTSNKSALNELKSFQYKSWVKTYWKVVTIRTKEKVKVSESSNTGWIIAFTIMWLVALLFIWLYVKVRKRIV